MFFSQVSLCIHFHAMIGIVLGDVNDLECLSVVESSGCLKCKCNVKGSGIFRSAPYIDVTCWLPESELCVWPMRVVVGMNL
jgi:hypothetical protein